MTVSRTWRGWLIPLPALLLAACGTATAVYEPVCLPMVEYDQGFRDQLADEIDAAPPGAAFPVFVADGITLRDRNRAACGDGG